MDARAGVRARLLLGVGLGLLTIGADLSFVYAHLVGATGVTVGLHLGVAGLASYGIAYRAFERALGGGVGRAVAFVGMLVGALGAAIHAVTGVVILDRIAAAPNIAVLPSNLPHVPTVLAPLWAVALVLGVGGAIVFAVAVLRGQTPLPRWAGLCNPVVVSLVVSAFGALSPTPEVVAAMSANAGQCVFFALMVVLTRRQADE